jgi:ferredoxin-NADP reductase
METPPQPARLAWQQARVVGITLETPRVKSFLLEPERWPGLRAGQHVDLRLSAPDGYQTERSYSIASAPDDSGRFSIAIEKLDDGEVSAFFHEVVAVGDDIEMRGPIGGHFIWTKEIGGPVLLFGGGSGVVPLMSILRHRAGVAPDARMVLAYSARSYDELIFREELLRRSIEEPNLKVILALTREKALRDGFHAGRIDAGLVGEALRLAGGPVRLAYVCGSNAFVEAASRLLLEAGVSFADIRTERYGGAAAT